MVNTANLSPRICAIYTIARFSGGLQYNKQQRQYQLVVRIFPHKQHYQSENDKRVAVVEQTAFSRLFRTFAAGSAAVGLFALRAFVPTNLIVLLFFLLTEVVFTVPRIYRGLRCAPDRNYPPLELVCSHQLSENPAVLDDRKQCEQLHKPYRRIDLRAVLLTQKRL